MQDNNLRPESMTDDEKWQYLLRHEKLGELLVKSKRLTLRQVEELLEEQKASGQPIGQLIVSKGLLSLDEILQALNLQHLGDKVSLESVLELKAKSSES